MAFIFKISKYLLTYKLGCLSAAQTLPRKYTQTFQSFRLFQLKKKYLFKNNKAREIRNTTPYRNDDVAIYQDLINKLDVIVNS